MRKQRQTNEKISACNYEIRQKKVMEKSEIAEKAREASRLYYREWRRKNPEKTKKHRQTFLLKWAERQEGGNENGS